MQLYRESDALGRQHNFLRLGLSIFMASRANASIYLRPKSAQDDNRTRIDNDDDNDNDDDVA